MCLGENHQSLHGVDEFWTNLLKTEDKVLVRGRRGNLGSSSGEAAQIKPRGCSSGRALWGPSGHPLGLKCWRQARDKGREAGRGHGTWICHAGHKESVKGFKVDNKTVPLSPKYNEGFICWEESSFKVACLVILLFTRKKKILEQSLGRGSVGLETEYFLISQPSTDYLYCFTRAICLSPPQTYIPFYRI